MIELCCIYLYGAFDYMLLSCHVVFHSESVLYSCLNVKELLARNRRDMWSLNNSNGIRTHNHLVRKRTLNHLAKLTKWLSCVVIIYLYGAFDCMLSSCHVRIWVPLLSLKLQIFEQEVPWHSGNYRCSITLKRVRDMIITYTHTLYVR